MKLDIKNTVTRAIGKTTLKVKKHSPELLLIAGVTGVVVSAVMACKATTKLDATLEQANEEIAAVNQKNEWGKVLVVDDNGDEEIVEYTNEDYRKELAIVYIQNGIKLVKLYGPAVTLGVSSIGCILASNNIIRKRNLALSAAYHVVDNGFKEYRGRVVERFGEELDRELKYNIKTKEVERVVVNEDGTETTVTETVKVGDPNYQSSYARFFDEYCKGWTKDPEMNLYFLRQVQNYCNEKLKAQGYLFLNDVYEELGIRKTKAGQCVGWVYDPKYPVGDNFIDFGIYDLYNEEKRSFVNGYEPSILLDFNVDGEILDHI